MLQPFTEGKAIVQLVLPTSWVTRINQLATERGINRSALIRQAIKATYFDQQVGVDGRGPGDAGSSDDRSATAVGGKGGGQRR